MLISLVYSNNFYRHFKERILFVANSSFNKFSKISINSFIYTFILVLSNLIIYKIVLRAVFLIRADFFVVEIALKKGKKLLIEKQWEQIEKI